MKKYFLILFGILLSFNFSMGGSFTWKGSVDSVFTNSSNWISISGGYPGSNDSVIIETGTYHPVLGQDRSIYSLTMTSGILDLKSYILTVQNRVKLDNGTINNGTLTIRGTSAKFNGTTLNTILDVESGIIEFNGGIFNNECHFKIIGNSLSSGTGGCVFNDDVVIVQHASRTELRMGTVNGDEFNGDLKLYITNDSHIYISYQDTSIFNGNVYVNNTGSRGSILFGDQGGVSNLTSGKTIAVGDSGYAVNNLYLSRFNQFGSTLQGITLTGSANLVLKGCSFNGSSTFTAPGILCSYSIFNSSANFYKTGTGTNYWYGSNSFYGNTIISNGGSGSATDVLRLSGTLGNVFYSDATFESNGKSLQVDYNGTSEFYKNIEVDNALITFKSEVKLLGSMGQSINGNVPISFMNLTIDKLVNNVTANTPIEIEKFLTLQSGNLITDSINLLIISAAGNVLNASNNSFVTGPVKKIGNSSFIFPTGKGSSLRAIGISAPDSITDAYTAEYIETGQNLGFGIDSTLSSLNPCEYWYLEQVLGNSDINITLNWGSNSCNITYPSFIRVAGWNDSIWLNMGNSFHNGSLMNGQVKSADSTNAIKYFTLSNGLNTYNGPPDFGIACDFALLSDLAIRSDYSTLIYGKSGSRLNTTNIISNDSILTNNTGSVPAAIDSLEGAILYCNGLSSYVLATLCGQTLTTNVYSINGNSILNQNLTLNGDSNSVFIFNVNGSLSIDSGATITLNGVYPSNIFWNVNGNFIKNLYLSFPGVVLCKQKITSYPFHNSLLSLFTLDSLILHSFEFDLGNNIYYSPCHLYELLSLEGDENCEFHYDGCNEIQNSNFDNYSQLPGGVSQIHLACPWESTNHPNIIATPDYFHVNATNASVDVPNNSLSCEFDNSGTGNAYSGVYVYGNLTPSIEYREYMTQYLHAPLVSGTQYYGEFFVSRSDWSNQGASSIGMHFSQTPLVQPATFVINTVTPQIQSGTAPIMLTNGWTRISGCFPATGIENIVTIGNFRTNVQTNTSPITWNNFCPTFGNLGMVYYYIDDPVVIPFTVEAGTSQTINCSGTVQLGGSTCISNFNTGQFTYSWSLVSGTLPAGLNNPSIFNPTVTLVNTTGISAVQVYQVTLTSPTGCTVTDQVTITVNPIDVTLTVINSCVGGLGSISSIVSGGQTPYGYIWNNGSAANNIVNLVNGNYTLTVTDANGCVGIESAQVQSTNYQFQIAGDFANCDDSGVLNVWLQSTFNSSLYTYYSWSLTLTANPNALPTPILNVNQAAGTATINPYPGQSVTITVTFIYGGCTVVATHEINACCEVTSGTQLADVESTDLLGLTGVSGTTTTVTIGPAANLVFYGVLTLNSNLVITGSNVRFGEGAYISVPSGRTLRVGSSVLEAACNNLWRGVRILSGGQIITTGASEIKDAEYAVKVENNGSYSINGCSFNKNYVGMMVSGPTFTQRSIRSSTFDGSGTLLPAFSGQTTPACTDGYAGMIISGISNNLTIGSITGPDVIFRDLLYGIKSDNSTTTIYRCKFLNINTTPSLNTCYGSGNNINGTGISATSGRFLRTLTQTGYGGLSTSTASFDNCYIGIDVRSMQHNISQNHIANVSYGLRTFSNKINNVSNFTNNWLKVRYRGIDIFNPQNGSQVNSLNNEVSFISAIYLGSRGINALYQTPVTGITVINDNIVNLQYGQIGIMTSNGNHSYNRIFDNDISFSAFNSGHTGIYIVGSPFLQTKCNDIVGFSQNVGSGIRSSISPNMIMQCNDVDGMLYGIKFENNNLDLDLITNEMSNNKHGLFLIPSSFLGDQQNHGNRWPTPPYGVRGATTMDLFPNPANYQFYVTTPVTAAPTGTTNNMSFLPGCSTCYPVCNRANDCELTIDNTRIGQLTLLDSAIIADTLSILEFSDFTRWSLRKTLVEKLNFYPELAEGSELVEDYLEEVINKSEWIAAEIKRKFTIFDFDQKDIYDQQTIWSLEIDSLKELSLLNDSIIFNPTDSADSSQAILESIIYRTEIDSLILLSEIIGSDLDSLQDILHVDVMTLNNSIDPITEFDSYFKTMNRLAIEKNINPDYVFSSTDSSIILDISNICPYIGGEAVFIARNLGIIYLNDSTVYEDDSLCVEAEARMAQNMIQSEEKYQTSHHYTAIPNPFDHKVKIICKDCIINARDIIVYDFLGHKIIPIITSNEIDFSGYAPGVYFVTVHRGKDVARLKVVKTP